MINLFNLDIVMVLGITDIDDKLIRKSNEVRATEYLKLRKIN